MYTTRASGFNGMVDCPWTTPTTHWRPYYTVLLYCMMILIIKLQNFPYTCFFCNNYNIDQLTNATSKERMATNIIFVGTTPIKVHMPVCFILAYARPVTQHYRQRRAWKYGKFTCDSARPYNWWVKLKRRKVCFWSCLTLYKQMDSVINTSAFSAVTKSSMKPWSSTITNLHLCVSEERNAGEQK